MLTSIEALAFLRPSLRDLLGQLARLGWLALVRELLEATERLGEENPTAMANSDRINQHRILLQVFLHSSSFDMTTLISARLRTDLESTLKLVEKELPSNGAHLSRLYHETLALLKREGLFRELGPDPIMTLLNLADASLESLLSLEQGRTDSFANLGSAAQQWFDKLPAPSDSDDQAVVAIISAAIKHALSATAQGRT